MDFIGFEEEFKDQSRKPRKTGRAPINRQTKINIVFDPEARRKFLNGFHKRKLERRTKYEEKLEKDLAEEKKRAKEEAKMTVQKKQSSSHSILPEVQHLIETDSSDEEEAEDVKTFDIGTTTVSIASLDDTILPKHLKIKKEEEESDDDGDEGGDGRSKLLGFMKYKGPSKPSSTSTEFLKRSLLKKAAANPIDAKEESLVKKEANRILQSSDAYKKALRMKQQKSRKFKLNKLQPGSRTEKKTNNKKNKKNAVPESATTTINSKGNSGGGGSSKKGKKSKEK